MRASIRTVLIFGATSRIAQETARLFATRAVSFFLVARDAEKLAAVADDLRVRGAGRVGTFVLDVNDFDRHRAAVAAAVDVLGELDLVLVAHGSLPDQALCEERPEEAVRAMSTNCTSVVSLLLRVAPQMEAQGHGRIGVIGSVAGDRGRRDNYVYGAAKGGLHVFLQGLRSRLFPHGVSVTTIKPGPVDTPMTAHLRQGFLFADATRVARAIRAALLGRREIVYVPWYWRWIILVLRSLPERLAKRLDLAAAAPAAEVE